MVGRAQPVQVRSDPPNAGTKHLALIDEHSRACLALKVARRINGVGVIEALADAMCRHGIPGHIRCDNGLEMISKMLRKWVAKGGSQIPVHRTGMAMGERVL